MKRRVILCGPARDDLAHQVRYFARENIRLERRFLIAVKRSCALLLRWPFIGSRWETENPAYADLRAWPIRSFENYLIFYRPTRHGIEILRILRGSRDLDTIFGADPDEP